MGALIRFTGPRLLLQRGFASEAIKGINILKSGSDPEIKPDEQYPQWVWQVGSPGKMLSQLNREQEDPEQETTMEEVNTVGGPSTIIDIWLHVQRTIKLTRRAAIKEQNEIKTLGVVG